MISQHFVHWAQLLAGLSLVLLWLGVPLSRRMRRRISLKIGRDASAGWTALGACSKLWS